MSGVSGRGAPSGPEAGPSRGRASGGVSAGPDAVGPDAVGPDAVGRDPVGSDAVGGGAAVAGLRSGEVGPFLARLARLDRAALVRLRPARGGAVTLWGRVPWGVLVARTVAGTAEADLTVAAAALLERVSEGRPGLPDRRDADWLWPVPTGPGEAVESVPVGELLRLGAAAAETLRSTRGRVGERVLRDALLDHVAITVDAGDGPGVEVRQGLVQAVLRMGFVTTGESGEATIRVAHRWVGLTSRHGESWQQTGANIAVRIVR